MPVDGRGQLDSRRCLIKISCQSGTRKGCIEGWKSETEGGVAVGDWWQMQETQTEFLTPGVEDMNVPKSFGILLEK